MRRCQVAVIVCVVGSGLLSLMTGCGGAPAGPGSVAASGTVTYNGKPVESGSLMFAPLDSKTPQAAQAVISHGKYATEPGKGLMTGKYKVTVSALKHSVMELDPKDAAKQKIDNNAVPKKYMDLKTTDLEVTVKVSDKSVHTDFALKD